MCIKGAESLAAVLLEFAIRDDFFYLFLYKFQIKLLQLNKTKSLLFASLAFGKGKKSKIFW